MGWIDTAGEGLKTVFKGAVIGYLFAIPVHDVWTGESLISKTWNSVVVDTMEDTRICKRGGQLDGTFICEKRGDGKGLGTLIPRR